MAGESSVHGETGFGPVAWITRAPEPFRRCSYCGSLHPEDFLAAAKAGARIDRGVDWKYGWPHKVYIHVPVDDPAAMFCIGAAHGGNVDEHAPGPSYVHIADLSEEQRATAIRDGMLREDDPLDEPHWLTFGTRAEHFGKFYNVHQAESWVSDEMRQAIGFHVGYTIEPAEGGKIRWRAFDYASSGPVS